MYVAVDKSGVFRLYLVKPLRNAELGTWDCDDKFIIGVLPNRSLDISWSNDPVGVNLYPENYTGSGPRYNFFINKESCNEFMFKEIYHCSRFGSVALFFDPSIKINEVKISSLILECPAALMNIWDKVVDYFNNSENHES